MSLLEMQRALCKVLTDSDFLCCFLLDKTAALAEFELSPHEFAAISGINADRLNKYFGLVLANRLELGLRAMPRVRKLLGSDFVERHGLEYARRYPPLPSSGESSIFTEFKNLLSFLEELAESRKVVIPFFSDTLQYDATIFILGNDPSVLKDVEQFELEYRSLLEADIVEECMPLRSPGSVIRTFASDISDGSDFQAASSENEVPTHVLFHRQARDRAIRLMRVSDATKRALELCDGQTPVYALAHQVAKEFGIDTDANCVQRCVNMCLTLSARGILGVRSEREQ